MIPYCNINKIQYGGDYNPEQWPEKVSGYTQGCRTGYSQ